MYYYQDTSLFLDNPFFIWSFVATICLDGALILLSNALIKCEKLNRAVKYIAGLTFGIYLLGDKLIAYNYFPNWNANIVIKIVVADIVSFVIGALITAVLKHIPLIKKIV